MNIRSEERRGKILDLLERDGQVRVTQLSNLFHVTTVTIRSDLDAMEADGLLERVQGGAIQTALSLYNREFQRRKQLNQVAKRAIATFAASQVNDGDSLFINGGTTTYYATFELKRKRNLNIVTNAINVAIELAMCPSFSVILIGGSINPYYSFVYGGEALYQLQRYHVNKAILSIDGINAQGITTIHPEEASIASAMIAHADYHIILADGSKVGVGGFANITDLASVDMLVTDGSVRAEVLDELRALNVNIHTV